MVIEEKPEVTPQIEWTSRDLYVLSLLGQQRALSLDHLPCFLALFEGSSSTMPSETLKRSGQQIIERLQQAGLVTRQAFDPTHWIWLTKGGLRYLGISSTRKAPTRAALPPLQAANALRLSLSEQYPQGIWVSREQLRQERSSQKLSPLPNMPAAEFETREGAYLAIQVLLHWTGQEHLVKSIREQLERQGSTGKPYYTALWYYATPNAASHLRSAFEQVVRECNGADTRLRVFSYPLVPKVIVYQGHCAPIRHLTWSPDGKWIASTDEDLTLQVWSVETGTVLFTRTLCDTPASALAWSPDGTRLALTDEESQLSIWDAVIGEQLSLTTVHQDIVTGLAWAPRQRDQLATCSADGSIQVLDLTRNEPVWKGEYGYEHRASALAWSPDGTRIAVGSDDTQVRLFDAATGQQLLIYKKHPHFISALAWSADSTLLASASDDLDVHIWEASSGKKVRGFWSSIGMVYRMDWSSDGKRLAWIGNEERVEVWDPHTGKRLFVYDDHAQIVNTIAWSPDGAMLASGSGDTTIHVYPVTGGSQ